MVLVRVAVLVAWGCVLPAAWCLSLHRPPPPPPAPLHPLPLAPQQQQQQQHYHHQQQQQQHLLRPLLQLDLRSDPDETSATLNRLEEEQILRELDDPTSPAAYRLQQALSQAADEALGGDLTTNDDSPSAEAVETVGGRGEVAWVDPRYFILNDYGTRGDETGSNLDNKNNNNALSTISEARNRRDSKSTNNNNNTNDGSTNSNTQRTTNKRNWPRGFSRRRSGLSLSIDASMKVLREALYLEIARKKQRQQLQRAQHNKALLNSIGKRDVSAQVSYRDTPALADRN